MANPFAEGSGRRGFPRKTRKSFHKERGDYMCCRGYVFPDECSLQHGWTKSAPQLRSKGKNSHFPRRKRGNPFRRKGSSHPFPGATHLVPFVANGDAAFARGPEISFIPVAAQLSAVPGQPELQLTRISGPHCDNDRIARNQSNSPHFN